MANTSRVGGLGGGTAPGVSDKSAEDGFQQALGRSTVAPAPVAPSKQGPKGPPRALQQVARPPQQALPGRPEAPLHQSAPRVPVVEAKAKPELALPDAAQDVGRFSSLSDRLVDMRRKLGVTQVELAKRMGSTQPAMARLEKGEMKPNLRTLARYGEAIGQRVQVAFGKAGNKAGAHSVGASEGRQDPIDRCTIDAVPETLSQLRRTLGITQSQVATAMETSQPVIARLESGEAVPNLRTLERYCEALGVEAMISFEALDA